MLADAWAAGRRRGSAILKSLEVVLALPDRVEPLRAVRSTLLVASVQQVQLNGEVPRYSARLTDAQRDTLLGLVAGVWIDVELAFAHYSAVDALGLPVAEQLRRGRVAADRLGGSIWGTASALAREIGATPWTFCRHFHRFWARGYDGGGVAVYKLGPKDARIDSVRSRLCLIPYYRRALNGWLEGMLGLVAPTMRIDETRGPAGPESVSFVARWV